MGTFAEENKGNTLTGHYQNQKTTYVGSRDFDAEAKTVPKTRNFRIATGPKNAWSKMSQFFAAKT